MSIVLPFLAVLVVGAFAAYHRLRLAVWAAAAITLLVACWLLGANQAATITAGVLVLLVAVPLLLPQLPPLQVRQQQEHQLLRPRHRSCRAPRS